MAACPPQSCKFIGCVDGVEVDVLDGLPVTAMPIEFTLCADDVCRTETIDRSQAAPDRSTFGIAPIVQLDGDGERDVAVTLSVHSLGSGEQLIDATGTAHVVRSEPNGSGCGPICFGARLVYEPTTKALTAPS